MEPVRFSKLSGNGNDFIVIDNRDKAVDTDHCVPFVKNACRRAMSVGADGVIFIENDPKAQCDFAWRFFNADGSEAEMCGNGGRCAARFAFANGIAKEAMSFRTLAGVIRARITGERSVKLRLTPPGDYEPSIPIDLDGQKLDLEFMNTGVPHAVIQVDDVQSVDVAQMGRKIRFHERFAPAGVNANFVQVVDDRSLFIRTYERGVEAETLACGTGAVAAALTMALAGKVKPPVKLTPTSGEPLTVDFQLGDGIPDEVYFEGDVLWVYDATLLPDSQR